MSKPAFLNPLPDPPAASPRWLTRLRDLKANALIAAGIAHGERVLTGPKMVQIDVTNRCNNNCIACWLRSPLLGDRIDHQDLARELPVNRVLGLIDELADLGTRRIHFAGGGDPLIYPRLLDLAVHVKRRGMASKITTNLTLSDRDLIDWLARIDLDELTVSIWAATGETYALTHPNKPPETFDRLVSFLDRLARRRRRGRPRITIYNVIFQRNVHEFERMVDLGERLGVDSVLFQMMDPVPGVTDRLLLTEEQRRDLASLVRRMETRFQRMCLPRSPTVIEGMGTFIDRLTSDEADVGRYDRERIETLPCVTGWVYARVVAGGDVHSCLKSAARPVGNILDAPFVDIWRSAAQRRFREMGVSNSRSHPYYLPIGCAGSCDNLDYNLRYGIVRSRIPRWQRVILSNLARLTPQVSR